LKTIIITGSTRGIGLGLAENFLKKDQRVVISGRTAQGVNEVKNGLAERFPDDRILGVACDMRDYQQVQDLWQKSADRFGPVDIWINNAGVAQAQSAFWDLDPETIRSLVDTNLIGAMFGAKVALKGFLEQGYGAFYNMEGLGSDGRKVEGLTLYGMSKSGLSYLTGSLADEVKDTDIVVGAIRPGMVLTDLILKQYENKIPEEWADARRIFNILADKVETVTPYIVDEVLKNSKNGRIINWLTPGKILWRFSTASFSKRDLFADFGMVN
jgi:NAD(P)-dependent dehydrogenase (short-subunit alcohol dehydrogenase family)